MTLTPSFKKHKNSCDWEEKKLKVSCLKNEYIEWKDKVRKTNVVIEEMISSIQEINEKLVPLQEKLLVKSSILEDAQKSKAKLNYRLVSTTNSIPSLVEEIQLGFSRRAKWEMDKGKHAKVAADIEDRFFKLKGLTF